MPSTLTLYSAAFALAQFWEKHHREPAMLECTNKNDLPHYKTLCRLFCSYSAALSAMYILVCSTGSAVNGKDFRVLKSAHRKCMGCGRSIRNEGAHVQHCRFCRYKLFGEEPTLYESGYALPRQWHILSMEDDLDDWDFII